MFNTKWLCLFVAFGLLFAVAQVAMAQETTGGLQGTVKDPSGATIPGAHVVVTGSALVGSKEADTDSNGYYRFANLPPGNYTITISAKGFTTTNGKGPLKVAHFPTFDFAGKIGEAAKMVEVTGEAL